MKKVLFISLLVYLSSPCWTQEVKHHQFSNAPETSRFQIVQSEIGARLTFNIDKYTGKVFLLVEGIEGLTWQLINAEKQEFDQTNPNQVNYQIFTSGLGVRLTFLINVNSGITWQLTEDTITGDYFWATMK